MPSTVLSLWTVSHFVPFPSSFLSGPVFRSGHRISTEEVESALVGHPGCAEAAVVGYEHAVREGTLWAPRKQ